MAREVLRELYILLGFQGDTKEAKEFETSLNSVLTAVKGFVAFKVAEKVGRELAGIAIGVADKAVQLRQSADALGYTTEQLQQLQYAAGTANVPVETIVSSLQQLRQLQAQQMTGDGGAVGLFGAIGAPGEDAVATLARMADRIKDLPPHLQRLAAQRAGLTELMPLLRMGGEYIRDMAKEAEDLGYTLGEGLVDGGNKLRSEMFRLDARLEILKNRMAEGLIPVGLHLAKVLLQLWDRFGKYMTLDNLRKAADRLVATLEALGIAIVSIGAVATVIFLFERWQGVVYLLYSTLLKARGAWVGFMSSMLSGALIWGLLLAAIVLVVDDLYALVKGGNSVLGMLYVLNPTLRKLTDFWGDLQQVIEDSLTSLGKLAPVLQPLIDGIKSLLGMRDQSTGAALAKLNKQLEDANEQRDIADMNDDKAGMARWSKRIMQLKAQRAELIREDAAQAAREVAASNAAVNNTSSFSYAGGSTVVNQNFGGSVSPAQAGEAAGRAVQNANDQQYRNAATSAKGARR